MYQLTDNELLDLGFSIGAVGHTFRQDFHSDGQDFYVQLYPADGCADMVGRVYGVDLTEEPSWVLLETKSFRNKPSLAEYITQFGYGQANFQKVNRLSA